MSTPSYTPVETRASDSAIESREPSQRSQFLREGSGPATGEGSGPATREGSGPAPRAEFLRGLRLGFPIFLGYLPVGLAFGLLACSQGFSALQAIICSATALAGAGQFIALSTLLAGGDAVTVLVATGVVNLRYVLFSATLSPWLRGLKLRVLALVGYSVTDETFAINSADLRAGTGTPASMVGVGVISWVGWVGGCTIGVLGAGFVGDPSSWGIDFAMPAMFAALFVALAENRQHVITGIISCGIVLLLAGIRVLGIEIDANWFIVIASIAGATIATIIFPDKENTPDEVNTGEEMLVAGGDRPHE